MDFSEPLLDLLGRLKALAGEYYELTGRALTGVSDEIAEYELPLGFRTWNFLRGATADMT